MVNNDKKHVFTVLKLRFFFHSSYFSIFFVPLCSCLWPYVSTIPLPWCSVQVILICAKQGLKIWTTCFAPNFDPPLSPSSLTKQVLIPSRCFCVSWQTAVNTTRQGSFPNKIVTYWTPTETCYNSGGDILARCAVNFCLAQTFAICVKPVGVQGWFPCYQKSFTPFFKGALLRLYHHWHLLEHVCTCSSSFASTPEFEKKQSFIQHTTGCLIY